MLRRERENRSQRFAGLLVCVVAGLALGTIHGRLSLRGRPDPVTASVRTVTAPLASLFTGIGRWSSRQIGWLFHGRTLAGENERLRRENARLNEEVARLRESDATVQRLRQQLGFRAPQGFNRLAADVIALSPSPSFETVLINRGSRDGVKVDSVVISSYGLVGHVLDVAPTSASVLLLTDANSSVGAMVQRAPSRAVGVCKGGSGGLTMTYLDRDADVKMGDAIVSSGLGGAAGVYPKGIVIGTVTGLHDDPSGAGKIAAIKPAVNFGQLEEVYVLQ